MRVVLCRARNGGKLTAAIALAPLCAQARKRANALLWAKRGIYWYFWLLILEGALRKWVFPQFSAPIALARDPVVLFIYWQAFRARRIKLSEFGGLGIVALCLLLTSEVQLFLAENDLITTAFGL